jgi:hypothetical protein
MKDLKLFIIRPLFHAFYRNLFQHVDHLAFLALQALLLES